VKPLAKRLIKHFGSFASVLSASRARLTEVEGVGEATVVAIKVAEAAALRLSQGHFLNRPVLSSWQALLDYCQAAMSHKDSELFRILFLDRKNTLIADEIQQSGTVGHAPVYPREVVKRALELGASRPRLFSSTTIRAATLRLQNRIFRSRKRSWQPANR
jgi:DNA repair protein RadC